MDNVTAGLHQPQPFLYIVKDAWKPFLSSRNGLCQVDSLTAPPADTTQREVTRSCALREKDQTAYVTWSRKYSVHSLAAQKRRAGVMATAGARACPKGARGQRDEATVACQKSGMYPTFDSAAGMGQIPLILGFIPYLILRVAGFDSASGPIPVNRKHCARGAPKDTVFHRWWAGTPVKQGSLGGSFAGFGMAVQSRVGAP